MTLHIGVALAALLFVSSAETNSLLRGQIVDEVGAVIPGAYIVIHPDSAGMTNGEVRRNHELNSDINGRFELDAKPGFYDVCVMSEAFVPQCQKVRIATGRMRELKFKLKVSVEVTKELD